MRKVEWPLPLSVPGERLAGNNKAQQVSHRLRKVAAKSASKSASKPHLVRVKRSKKKSVGVKLDIKRNRLIFRASAMP